MRVMIAIFLVALSSLFTGCVGIHSSGMCYDAPDLNTVYTNLVQELRRDGYRTVCTASNGTFRIVFRSSRVKGEFTGKWIDQSSGCIVEKGLDYDMDVTSRIWSPFPFSAAGSARDTIRRGIRANNDSNRVSQVIVAPAPKPEH
jgi:hypothetical protein